MNKKCTKCKQTKPTKEFYYHRTRKHYMSSCKECNSKECLTYQNHSKYRQTVKYVMYQRAYQIKERCKIKSIPVMQKLEEHLAYLWSISNKCYYTNKKMFLTGYHTNKLAMTVDRKDPSKGYTKNNIVLCCSIVNRMKQDLTHKELLRWCKILLRKEG